MTARTRRAVNTLEYRGQRTCLLTDTTAMSCPSWSLPAAKTCPGMRARDGDICRGCYAQMNRYNDANVARSQWIRYSWIRNALRTDEGTRRAIRLLVAAIRQEARDGYFRGHDSGDFFSSEYVRLWARVCRALPGIRFWFPTRSWWLPGRPDRLREIDRAIRLELATLPNVVVRPSALRWDSTSPTLLGYAAGTTAVTKTENPPCMLCPKSMVPEGSCAGVGCRICWQKDAPPVAYYVHGIRGRHRVTQISPRMKPNTRGGLRCPSSGSKVDPHRPNGARRDRAGEARQQDPSARGTDKVREIP